MIMFIIQLPSNVSQSWAIQVMMKCSLNGHNRAEGSTEQTWTESISKARFATNSVKVFLFFLKLDLRISGQSSFPRSMLWKLCITTRIMLTGSGKHRLVMQVFIWKSGWGWRGNGSLRKPNRIVWLHTPQNSSPPSSYPTTSSTIGWRGAGRRGTRSKDSGKLHCLWAASISKICGDGLDCNGNMRHGL